jgi:dipeptidyl aminopeptidase/acylaminoacyl peptidase
VGSEHVLFIRQGALFAQAFDSARLELAGEAFRMNGSVGAGGSSNNVVAVSASSTGTVAFRTGATRLGAQLIWFDRTGKEVGRINDAGDFGSEDLSHDGRRLALSRYATGNSDVWVFDTLRGGWNRITSDETPETQPVWSPDGGRLAFLSVREGSQNLYVRPATTSGTDELVLAKPGAKKLAGWSPDGRFLLFSAEGTFGVEGVWAVPVQGDHTPIPVVQTRFPTRDAQFSPDGKWIAYQSNESGRSEIYAQPFPGPGERVPITTTGGAEVRWRGDGKELFYIALDERLMAVPVRLDADGRTLDPGRPVPLFTALPDTRGSGNEYRCSRTSDHL